MNMFEIAQSLPNMGAARIGKKLYDFAKSAPENSCIVEVGSWLGCGTAHLALGAGTKQLHVYDRFQANASEIEKAAAFGVNLSAHQDTLLIVQKNLKGFPGRIWFHKGDITKAVWIGQPIGLYVDDASKTIEKWNRVVTQFIPYMLVGCKLVLMDYWYFQTTGEQKHRAQYDFMNMYKSHFRYIENLGKNEALFEVIKSWT